MVEKKSDFIFSTLFNLSHIALKALVSSIISGGDVILRSLLKIPFEISFVFSINDVNGFVMLLVVKKEVNKTRTKAVTHIISVSFLDELPASLSTFIRR